ncbi:MAG: hypothetical protein QW088_07465 [Desulfurococcaceae archaeon]
MKRRRWSGEELDFLRENYGRMRVLEIAKSLNRTVNAVMWKVRELGLKYRSYRRWSSSEVDFLKENWGKMKLSEIARALGRSSHSVRLKAESIGLTKRRSIEEELLKIVGEVYVGRISDLEKSINASRESIIKALRRLRSEGRLDYVRLSLGEHRGKFSSHKLFRGLSRKLVVWTNRDALVRLLLSELNFCRQTGGVRKSLKRVLKQLLGFEVVSRLYEACGFINW